MQLRLTWSTGLGRGYIKATALPKQLEKRRSELESEGYQVVANPFPPLLMGHTLERAAELLNRLVRGQCTNWIS